MASSVEEALVAVGAAIFVDLGKNCIRAGTVSDRRGKQLDQENLVEEGFRAKGFWITLWSLGAALSRESGPTDVKG